MTTVITLALDQLFVIELNLFKFGGKTAKTPLQRYGMEIGFQGCYL